MTGDNETNFSHKLLLNLRKAFANRLSTDIELSKTELSKMYNQEDFLVDYLVHY